MSTDRNQREDAKAKGDVFEDYFAFKLVKVNLECTERRSDKLAGGKPVRNNADPDFVWETKDSSHEFGVECKYRSAWWKDKHAGLGIKLGKTDGKYRQYAKFAEKRRMPVFLVLALGGKPDSPRDIYIVPLEKVSGDFIPKSLVEQYESPDPRGVFEYRERGDLCALFQGKTESPNNWQPLQQLKPIAPPFREQRLDDDPPARIGNCGLPTPAAGKLVRIENCTIFLNHSEPPPRPNLYPQLREVSACNPPLRRFRWLLALGLLASMIALFVWQHNQQNLAAPQAPRQESPPERIAAEPVKIAIQAQSLPLVSTAQSLSRLPARALPLLQYKANSSHSFRLSIETVEPASDIQVERAAEDAQRAVSLFEPGALPPFFAVPTEPSERTPQLSAYMVYDTQTNSFCSRDVYLTASEQSPRTVALVQRFECFFVTPRWLTDEQRRLRL